MKKIDRFKGLLKRLLMSKAEKRHELVGPPKLWKMKQDFQITFLKNHGLLRSQTLLDVGCGTLRGGIPLIEYLDSGNYTGIDVREAVLVEGKKGLKEHNLLNKNPKLICFNNFKDLNLDSKFDKIFSFSVLIHLEDSIVKDCFSFINRHLANDGVFYANVNIGSLPDGNWQGFPVVWRPLEFYEELSSNNGLELKVLGNLGDLGHVSGVASHDNQTMLEIRKIK